MSLTCAAGYHDTIYFFGDLPSSESPDDAEDSQDNEDEIPFVVLDAIEKFNETVKYVAVSWSPGKHALLIE